LVDVTLAREVTYTDGQEYGTTPIWHCEACNHTFGNRTYSIDSILKSSVNGTTLKNDESTPTSKWDIDLRLRGVETTVGELKDTMSQMQADLKNKDDVLSSLRDRVLNFTLV